MSCCVWFIPLSKHESIPVGCEPTAAVATTRRQSGELNRLPPSDADRPPPPVDRQIIVVKMLLSLAVGQLNYYIIVYTGTKLVKVKWKLWHLTYFALFCNDNKYTQLPTATIISCKELILMWAEEISPDVNASWRTLRPYFFRQCMWLPSGLFL